MPISNPNPPTVLDEDVIVRTCEYINFTGAGVVATYDAVTGRVDVTIAGGAGTGDMDKATYDPDEDGVIASAQLDTGLALLDGSRTYTGDMNLGGFDIGYIGHFSGGNQAVDALTGFVYDEAVAIADNSVHRGGYFNPRGAKADAAFTNQQIALQGDSMILATNSQNWSHSKALVGVYAAPQVITGATGNLGGVVSVQAVATLNGMVTTNRYGLYVNDAGGTATLTNQYGVYIEEMDKGGTLNWGLYNLSDSYFAKPITLNPIATASLPVAPLEGMLTYDATLDKLTYRDSDSWEVVLAVSDVDDTPVNGADTVPVSSNWAFDHVAAADPHTGYMLESVLTEQGDVLYASGVATLAALPHGTAGQVLQSGGHAANPSWLSLGTMAAETATDYVAKALFDAHTVLYATSDNTPAALSVTEQTVVGRITSGNIAALSVAQLQTLIFSAALPENIGIFFDEALSADGKYSGFVTSNFKAGATLAFGDAVYLAVADDRWELTDSSAEATTKCLAGICVLAAAGDGSDTTVLLLGKVRADTAFPSFTKYAPVFFSETAGDLTSTAPITAGACIRVAGWAWSADELWVQPSGDWFEHA
jgi:hypothetical protein